MRLHLRFDRTDSHTRATIFINGGSCGQLTMRPEEAIWLHHILYKGSHALRRTPGEFAFQSSGTPPTVTDEAVNALAVAV